MIQRQDCNLSTAIGIEYTNFYTPLEKRNFVKCICHHIGVKPLLNQILFNLVETLYWMEIFSTFQRFHSQNILEVILFINEENRIF